MTYQNIKQGSFPSVRERQEFLGGKYKPLEVQGPLRGPTSSWRPFGPLDFVLRALRALRPVCWARLRSGPPFQTISDHLDHFRPFYQFGPFLPFVFSPFWTILDRLEPFWTILDHFDHVLPFLFAIIYHSGLSRPFRTILDHFDYFGPSWTILGHFGPFWAGWIISYETTYTC